jgi:hypothetical protein
MMLGQGKADYSRNQGDRPTSNGHRDCVECTYPLLVNLKQCPEMFYRRWLLSVRVRLVRPPSRTMPSRLMRCPIIRMVRATDWLTHLWSA